MKNTRNKLIDAACRLVDFKLFNGKPLTARQKSILSNKPILNIAHGSFLKAEKELIFVQYGVWVNNKLELRLEQERLAAYEKRFSGNS
jgi:hypothetical protein